MNTKHCILFLLLAPFNHIHSMNEQAPLSDLEKQLLKRAIYMKGKNKIIDQMQEPRLIRDENTLEYFRDPTILKIKFKFYKTDTDMLTPIASLVFKKIEELESQSTIYVGPGSFTELEPHIWYAWCKRNGEFAPAVNVQANLTNKTEVESILSTY